MRNIYKASNIGFCYGVRNAIRIANIAIQNPHLPRPIYLLGSLVHNHFVNEYFLNKGIIILNSSSRKDMIEKIDRGTVIFTAHGVSEEIVNIALSKNLYIIDATCPYVERTQKEMKKVLNLGNDLIFIGKKDHPETQTALSLSNHVYLYNEISKDMKLKNPFLAHQTTLSNYDVLQTFDDLKKTFPTLSMMKMVCNETEKRQQLILKLKENNLNNSIIIVVGDKSSNNSTKLYEMAQRLNKCPVLFIDNISELDFIKLKEYQNFYLFSGTSAPSAIVDEIENSLLNIDQITIATVKSNLTIEDYIKK